MRGQAALDARVQPRHAPGPFAHGAEHAEGVEVAQHLRRPGVEAGGILGPLRQPLQVGAVAAGRAVHRQRRHAAGVGGLHERELGAPAVLQQLQRRGAVAAVQRLRQLADGAGKTPAAAQHHGLLRQRGGVGGRHRRQLLAGGGRDPAHRLRVVGAVLGGAGHRLAQVAQHRAGLDRRELVAVAQQHQARAGRQGGEQAGHHLQVHHRGFVDEEHVDLQRLGRVVHEAACAGPRAQQRVQRAGRPQPRCPAGQPQAVAVLRLQVLQRGADRLPQPRRGLAGGRGQCHAQGLRPGMQRLQQHQQPGRGVGLAGARAARDDAERRAQRHGAGHALPVDLGAVGCGAVGHTEQPVHPRADPGRVRGRGLRADRLRARPHLCRHLPLLAPVAAQRKAVVLQHQRRGTAVVGGVHLQQRATGPGRACGGRVGGQQRAQQGQVGGGVGGCIGGCIGGGGRHSGPGQHGLRVLQQPLQRQAAVAAPFQLRQQRRGQQQAGRRRGVLAQQEVGESQVQRAQQAACTPVAQLLQHRRAGHRPGSCGPAAIASRASISASGAGRCQPPRVAWPTPRRNR